MQHLEGHNAATLRTSAAAHRAAGFLARLVACGWLGRAEALAALLQASSPALISACGRKARISSLPSAGLDPSSAVRGRAAYAARQALIPLIAAAAPIRSLLAASQKAARPTLRNSEIQSLTTDAIARHIRNRLRKGRRLPTETTLTHPESSR